MISPLASASLRGASMTSSTGTSRRPLGPTIDALAPAAISAGTLSAAGEPLHRLPPMVARPWICVEPIRLAASTTPGQTDLSFGVLLELGAGDRGADAKAAGLLLDLAHLGDALDVDHQNRVDQVGAHLHQQIGAARQHPRIARFLGEQRDRLVERTRRLIAHMDFLLTGCAPAAWHSQPPSANPAAKMLHCRGAAPVAAPTKAPVGERRDGDDGKGPGLAGTRIAIGAELSTALQVKVFGKRQRDKI